MNFLRSKAEHLADHLREAITSGTLAEPLPNLREWSARLGVAHGTLETALRILKREGLVRSHPRKGIHIVRGTPGRTRLQQPPIVRMIEGRNVRDIPAVLEIMGSIAQRLSPHGIRLSIEISSDARLKMLHKQGQRPHELLVFTSLPRRHQEMFSDFDRNVLLIGGPFPGIHLPFIALDVLPAIRHAAFLLARRGFEQITLVISESSRQPIHDEFMRICGVAPRPVRGEMVRLPDELYAQNLAAQHLASRIRPRHGLIAISPVQAGLLMLALARRGLRVPEEVEVIAVNATAQSIRTVPVPIHYPHPAERFAKVFCRAVIHYFEQGALPPLRKLIALELVSPPR